MESLNDIFVEEEARLLTATRAEIAAEKAAWNALTDEERAAHTAAVEAKYSDIFDVADSDDDDSEDEPEEDDDNHDS